MFEVRIMSHGIPQLSLLAVVVAAGAIAADSPPTGRIGGSVTPGEKVRSIVAVPRFLNVTCEGCKRQFVARANAPGGKISCKGCGKSFPVPTYAASIDKANSLFEIRGLPVGQRYDLIVETTAGRIEGVDLSPLETDLERLSRRSVKANPREFSDEDRAAVVDLITKTKQFENYVRPIYVRGHGEKAAALVEKGRLQDDQTGSFHSEQGNEAIWRVELWYFRKWYGGWERVSNVEAVLYRRRMPRSEYDAMKWVFSDALGGIEVDQSGSGRPVAIHVPESLDPNLGRAGNANAIR